MQIYADRILDEIPIYIKKDQLKSLSYSPYTYLAIFSTLMCQQTAMERTPGDFFPPKYGIGK